MQKLVSYDPANITLVQTLEVTVHIGKDVPVGLYHVDINLGRVHAYTDELSQAFATGEGAHRMKDALAIVRLGYTTPAGECVASLKTSRSLPRIVLDPLTTASMSVNGDTATITLSGRVDDSYAGLVSQSVLNQITICHAGETCGAMPLQVVNDQSSEWAPHAKHFTFNGTVQIKPATGGQGLLLNTNPNDMGVQGTASVSTEVEIETVLPSYPRSWRISFAQLPADAVVDEAQVTVPGLTPGSASSTFTATETAADSNVFAGPDGYRVTIEGVSDWHAQALDSAVVQIEKSSELLLADTFWETAESSLEFVCTEVAPLQGPVTLAYTLELPAGEDLAATQTVLLRLPEQLAGANADAVPLQRVAAETGAAFAGSWADLPVSVALDDIGAAPGPCGTLSMASQPVAAGTFVKSDGPPVTYAITVAFAGNGPNYKAKSCEYVDETLPEEGWEPYHLTVQVPAALPEGFVERYDWWHCGLPVSLTLKPDGAGSPGVRTYVEGAEGNPAVRVAAADVPQPIAGPGAGADGKGDFVYHGTLTKEDDSTKTFWVRVVARAENIQGQPPASLQVQATIANDGPVPSLALTITSGDTSLKDEDVHADNEWQGLPAGTYVGSLALDEVQRQAGNFGAKAKEGGQKLAAPNPTTTDGDQFAVWIYWKLQGQDTEGWVWNENDNSAAPRDALAWTAPLDEPAVAGCSMTLRAALRKVLAGTSVIPGPRDLESDPRLAFREHLLQALAQNTPVLAMMGVDQIKRFYGYFMADDTWSEVTDARGRIRDEYLTPSGALHYNKLVDLANAKIRKQNDAAWAAYEARRKRSAAMVSTLVFSIDYTNPARYLQALQFINVLVDPFAWCAVLWGEDLFSPIEGEATWTAVALLAGSLVLDVLPATKAISAVAKGGKVAARTLRSSKAIFRKVTGYLPETRQLRQIRATEGNIAQHCIGSSCFAAGTPVLTDAGWRLIETIRAGDRVFSRNPATGSSGYRRVTASFTTHNAELVRVTARPVAADGGYLTFTGTGAHPAWSETRGAWTALGDLRPGERLATDTGAPAAVVNADTITLNAPATTYNFTVDEWHTYFVGASTTQTGAFGVWVHNSQQRACGQKWLSEVLGSFIKDSPARRLQRLRSGDLKDLLPHQKYTLWKRAAGERLHLPSLDQILDWRPKNGYDVTQQIWEGRVEIFHKDAKAWIPFEKGFPDLSRWLDTLGAGLKPHGTQWVEATGSSWQDLGCAWKAFKQASGIGQDALRLLRETHTWHHTIDICGRKVKMLLVPKSVHSVVTGGASHTGGFAVVKWMMDNGLWPTR
jgi:hypothetical protein